MESNGNNVQGALGLEQFWARKPKDAPTKLVRSIDSESQAVAVAIAASGFKLAYLAQVMGKSEGYISRIRSGKRPVPDKFIRPFCRAVGNRLLEQYVDMRKALDPQPRDEIARLAGMLREAA